MVGVNGGIMAGIHVILKYPAQSTIFLFVIAVMNANSIAVEEISNFPKLVARHSATVSENFKDAQLFRDSCVRREIPKEVSKGFAVLSKFVE